ncbi:MAG: (2S)-3-sulfopropanediol dehydratase [Anaerovoracaceae bacterium]|jgi:pyruvate formate-lyase/glycerol dehydratase family glycyl radical enzyme
MINAETMKNRKSGKPTGTEPFDKTYGTGYDQNHGDWSPYPRVNKLRKVFLDREFNIDIQRAKLITEVYRDHPELSAKMKTARSLEHIVNNVDIELYDDELIIGGIAAPAKAAPIYPEFSIQWIIDELEENSFHTREHDKFYITEEDRQEMLKIAEFWKGRSIADEIDRRMSTELKKGSELGWKIYMTNLYHYAGIGHFCMDYPKLMRIGFEGFREEVRRARGKLDLEDADFKEKKELYDAMEIELNAATSFIERYADAAGEAAAAEKDEKRKKELQQIEANCRQVASGPAESFWQALQLWYFATNIALIESNGHSVSYGRMDQWLYPYYEKDLEKGVSKEFMQELLECTYIQMGNPSKLKDKQTTSVRNGRGWGGESLTIGGVDADGNDATNDLTFMMLEASVHTRMMNPWVCVRVHKDMPYELKVKTIECIRAGYGHPKLYNDGAAIPLMMNKGMSLEEARDYAVVGCVEPDLPGREYGWHDAAYVNVSKILELALNGGRRIEDGAQLGPDNGDLTTFKNMDEVMDSFRKQMDYWGSNIVEQINLIDDIHREMKPLPYASLFVSDCIESGRDVSEGGARYNFSGPQGSGIATCADSLSVISQLVFDEKKFSGQDFLDALKDNWEGHEVLYRLVNSSKMHHYGNDDDYADRYFQEVFDSYCDSIEVRPNRRGGYFTPGVYSVNANVGMGMNSGASADGRKAGEPVSDNMGPVHTAVASHDRKGPTAIANSVTKVNHSRATNGTLLNWKFPPECVAGREGRDNLIRFCDSYFSKKPIHCQFNIMSTETMKAAQQHPEDYKDMLVRVAGYSAYFVELGKPLQDDLINRTELSF